MTVLVPMNFQAAFSITDIVFIHKDDSGGKQKEVVC